mmetsp:Transcript_66821/g.159914  ORF Transcript_66821/g.159914 Transcript_66821/m.159914 type:complete len:274 (-) Transcript_66821:73-894(-)
MALDLRQEKKVLLEAMESAADDGGLLLANACDALRADQEVVLAAVACSSGGDALEYAADRLKSDKDFVLSAIQRKWSCLEHAAADLRSDPDVVLAALQQHASALQLASQSLRSDKEFILETLRRHGPSLLQYASQELKSDGELITAAVRQCGAVALAFASEEFKANAALMREVMDAAPDSFTDYYLLHISLLSGRACGCMMPRNFRDGMLRSKILLVCARKLSLYPPLLLRSAELLYGTYPLSDNEGFKILGCGQVHELHLVLKTPVQRHLPH